MIEFGQRLRASAQAMGLSDAEVARRAGLTERRYGHYVTGAREPDLATLARICKVLGGSPNDLLNWDSGRKRSPQERRLQRLSAAAQRLSPVQLEMLVVQAEALARHHD